MDVWKAGGPQIDMLAPDSYSESDFVAFCASTPNPANPLFIPENMGGPDGAAPSALRFRTPTSLLTR